MRTLRLPITLLIGLLLSACSTLSDYIPWVYKVDIKQGNIIDQDMIDQLRPNMTKRQVLYIMGSPMLNDYFHKQRWDYVYSTRENGDQKIQKRVTLFFNDDELVKIEGDLKPNDKPVAKVAKESSITIKPRKLEQTIGEKISSWFDWSDADDAVAQERQAMPNESNNLPIPVKKF